MRKKKYAKTDPRLDYAVLVVKKTHHIAYRQYSSLDGTELEMIGAILSSSETYLETKMDESEMAKAWETEHNNGGNGHRMGNC